MIEALRGKDITDISLGSVHCLALTREGKVFSWGGNDKGQLGISNCESKNVPTEVGEIEGTAFQYVACGPAQVPFIFYCSIQTHCTDLIIPEVLLQMPTSSNRYTSVNGLYWPI